LATSKSTNRGSKTNKTKVVNRKPKELTEKTIIPDAVIPSNEVEQNTEPVCEIPKKPVLTNETNIKLNISKPITLNFDDDTKRVVIENKGVGDVCIGKNTLLTMGESIDFTEVRSLRVVSGCRPTITVKVFK